MKSGDIAIVQPCDDLDPVSLQWAGERVQVLRTRDTVVSTHVYVVLADPVPGKAYRAVLRLQDLEATGD